MFQLPYLSTYHFLVIQTISHATAPADLRHCRHCSAAEGLLVLPPPISAEYFMTNNGITNLPTPQFTIMCHWVALRPIRQLMTSCEIICSVGNGLTA